MSNTEFFGPSIEAEVRVDENGKVQDIRVAHPNGRNDIIIPAGWASDPNASPVEILRQVAENLNGAKLRMVRLVPVDEA